MFGMTDQRIIIGAGGHALSIASAAAAAGLLIRGLIAPRNTGVADGYLAWLGDEDCLQAPSMRDLPLLNGIGSAGPIGPRRDAYLRLRAAGHRFSPLIHPAASLSTLGVQAGDAPQVLAGVLVNAAAELGDNVLLNSGAIVEHGCRIGHHCHVATGAVLCGEVRLGESVHVGAGATILQGVTIGAGAVIAAGAVVTKDVEPLTLVAGVPARPLRRIHEQELA
jgi:UDP-perosamine 4-acetyltransferase